MDFYFDDLNAEHFRTRYPVDDSQRKQLQIDRLEERAAAVLWAGIDPGIPVMVTKKVTISPAFDTAICPGKTPLVQIEKLEEYTVSIMVENITIRETFHQSPDAADLARYSDLVLEQELERRAALRKLALRLDRSRILRLLWEKIRDITGIRRR